MYYIRYKTFNVDEEWQEIPGGYRHRKDAHMMAKALYNRTKEDGTRCMNVQLCIGKGRDRRYVFTV